MTFAVTTYAGPAGDHNERAMGAVSSVGQALGRRLGAEPMTVGSPQSALSTGWETELAHAIPVLRQMAGRIERVLVGGAVPVSAITRCAVALATQPVVLRHRPDTVVVWLDGHGDLNVPSDTTTGYLGGMALSGPLGWWDSGLGAGLPTEQAVLVGSRDLDPAEREHVDAGRVALVAAGPGLGERLAAAVAGRPVYFHLDCDVLEPGLVATDYRVPDGLSLDDLRSCAQALSASELVGAEIGELEGEGTASVEELLDALDPLWGRGA